MNSYQGGANVLQSETPLEGDVGAVPTDVQSVADHLRKQNHPSEVGSYGFRLSVLVQVRKTSN